MTPDATREVSASANGGGAHASPSPASETRAAREPATIVEVFARAMRLHAFGLGRGERVGILSDSSPEWVLVDVGCQFAGVINAPIYPTLAPQQVCYILEDSGARVLFVQNGAAFERVRASVGVCGGLSHVVVMEGEAVEGALTLEELEARGAELEAARPGLLEEISSAVSPEDLATIIYTSGTTGETKGVMLTLSNVVSNLIGTSERLAFTPEDVVLSVLPLSHVFERGAMYMYLHHGAKVFFAESIEKIGQNLREVRPTLVVAVPRLYEKIYARIKEKAAEGGKAKTAILLWAVRVARRWARGVVWKKKVPAWLALEHKLASKLVFSKWREGVGGRIRLFLAGGAALPEELGLIFYGAGLPSVQGYGLTETSPVITVNGPADNRVGTVGRPIRHAEVRIAEDGEIEARGPNIMRGYYNKPEATREVFTADGWFKTGDIGTLDAEGYLRITDRKKELLKTSGGKYIAPQPIEQSIKRSRFVNQVVLIGNGRKFPAALIVPDWEMLRSYAQLKGLDCKTPAEFCRNPRVIDLLQRQVDSVTEDLSRYERVKRIALLERELTVEGGELTPTLKIKRRVIDEKYRDVIDRIYEEAEASGHAREG